MVSYSAVIAVFVWADTASYVIYIASSLHKAMRTDELDFQYLAN